VLDKTGQAINEDNIKKQMRFCELCKKYSNNPASPEKNYPCEKLHADSVTESRLTNKTKIYSCAAGLAFLTSPIYLNRLYSGALISGLVLSCGRKEAEEKFFTICQNREAVEIFNKMLEDVTEKNPGEIQAMARLLGLCAEEISDKTKIPGKTIRHMAWYKEMPEESKMKAKIQSKKTTHVQLEKERMLLATFQRGDKETGNKILHEIMNGIVSNHPNDLKIIRFKAIELLVLLSRAAVSEGDDTVFESNNRFFKLIYESKTQEELIQTLSLAVTGMAGKIFSFQGVSHASALRRAQRYIWDNYTRKLSLDEISKASGLSAPYFSTIFNEEMGEKLSNYLNRLRIERAAAMLKETGKSLDEITELCGFEDQSWFSKVFKRLIGVSPGKYRKTGNIEAEKKYERKEFIFMGKNNPRLNKQGLLSS
jgi:YesN/AraC family two-component response regulator